MAGCSLVFSSGLVTFRKRFGIQITEVSLGIAAVMSPRHQSVGVRIKTAYSGINSRNVVNGVVFPLREQTASTGGTAVISR
jgi:hypothetical protein